ncbi:MAG: CorA family divalent cation transporter [Cellulosilyticaceae bacterium]
MAEKLYSQHLFLFSFSYLCGHYKTIYFKMFEALPNWEPEYVVLKEDKDYNEFVYFYKSVRFALYTFENAPIIVRNYKYKYLDETSNECIIGVENAQYHLKIDKISLKLYKSGIGILGLHLRNNHYENPEDILRINSFSKCIYPYVLPIEKAKVDLFPDYIKLKLNHEKVIEEFFNKDYKQLPISISDIVMELLGMPFAIRNRCKENVIIEPILGNQMFVICLYQQAEMVDAINQNTISDEFLERFILLNDRIKCQSERNIRLATDIEYIKNRETIYATSRFSLIAVSKKLIDIKIYDQLVHLILMQRATLLSFSNELAIVSTLQKRELVVGIQNIYEIYIQFVNQLYFKEVTEEIQGTQIYDSLSRQLRIEEELHQLDFEIDEVHEYATLVEQSQSKFNMSMITLTGAALVIPTFVTGFFGMNILQKDWYDWWNHKEVLLWMNAYVLMPMLIAIGIYTWNMGRCKKYKVQRILIVLIIAIAFVILCQHGTGIP